MRVEMDINHDFKLRVVVLPDEQTWEDSPVSGVTRKKLDRIGQEVARATSIVQYAADSRFNSHQHGGGEEILVLAGTFCDEHGVYPEGTYLRHPPGSQHAPFSVSGCILFVKLRQFRKDDVETVQINTRSATWYQGMVTGLTVLPLHQHDGVNTALVRWAPNTVFNPHTHPGGEEIYVLEGVFHDEHGSYPEGTWIRSPPYSKHAPFTGSEGALIYVKTGHLDIQEIIDP